MQIFVRGLEKIKSLECESTDTIIMILDKVHSIEGIPPHQHWVEFEGKTLELDKTLTDAGIQKESTVNLIPRMRGGAPGQIERPRIMDEVLLDFLVVLCEDGTISGGNVTDVVWLRIQNDINNSMNNTFEIDFLKGRLRDYKQLYSLLTETSSSCFCWRRKKKTNSDYSNWLQGHVQRFDTQGVYPSFFRTLEKLCSLLNSR